MNTSLSALLTTLSPQEGVAKSVEFGLGHIFGGQLIAQAISAAQQDLAKKPEYISRLLYSCNLTFLASGSDQQTVSYQVVNLKDGNTFSVRQVSAWQQERLLAQAIISFQDVEKGFEHQIAIPEIQPPELLPSFFDVLAQPEQKIPAEFVQALQQVCPFDVKMLYPTNPFQARKLPPYQYTWFKTTRSLALALNQQQLLLAYLSDFNCLPTALHPHSVGFMQKGMTVASLDHILRFYRPFDMNEWLVYVVESSNANNGRAVVNGRFFDRRGNLIASVEQEGLIRCSHE